MAIFKKFTKEFPDYLKNVFLCSTNLFSNYEFKKWEDEYKKFLSINSRILYLNSINKIDDTLLLKVVSFNVMKFFNKEKIIKSLDSYIEKWFHIFLLQEVIVLDWENSLQEYFYKKWFYTYFHPTSNNIHKTEVNNFDFIWTMIVSKFEIFDSNFLFYDIVRPNNWWYKQDVLFWMSYSRINIWWKKIWLYNTHSDWYTKPYWRNHQISQFIQWSDNHKNDYIVLWWDFNTWLPTKFEKCLFYISSQGFIHFRNKIPFISLDHIFLKWFSNFKEIYIKSDGSDHTAIACEINL